MLETEDVGAKDGALKRRGAMEGGGGCQERRGRVPGCPSIRAV